MSQNPAGAGRGRIDSRRRVLEALRSVSSGCTAQQIAEQIALHPNTVRFHLERLEADGLAHRQARREGAQGRPMLIYTAAPLPEIGHGRREYGQLAEVLAQLVARTNTDPTTTAVEAGRAWAQALTEPASPHAPDHDAFTALVRILTDLGFAPVVDNDGQDRDVIIHRHCPFLEVAQSHQDIVCAIHLGLMRAILDGPGAQLTIDRLVPFAGPTGCEAHLRPRWTVDANGQAPRRPIP